MVKIIIDWGEDLTKIDEFRCNYAVGRAVFTLLSRMSDTWAIWEAVEKAGNKIDSQIEDPGEN